MFPQIFGKYVLEGEIAAGGMAVVYLATLRGAGGFEKRLVVKQIRADLASDDAFVRRFVEEAKTTVELSHPNIVPVYELGVEQGVYYIAMELAEGVTLSELLATEGRLAPEEGAYIGVEVCRALDYAHRRAGVVHRDVTPRNIVIDEEGAVRLIDFGIAAPVSRDGAARERVFGSPGHMPLEQIRGGRLSAATDVFAVAAALTEAWTGKPPFRRATAKESEAALTVAPPPLSDVEVRLMPLDSLIASALSSKAEDRPQRADDLSRPLREFLKAADIADVARGLGDKVRKIRGAGAAESDRFETVGTKPLLTGATPVTRTFAAGERLLEWTRPSQAPSGMPPEQHADDAPSDDSRDAGSSEPSGDATDSAARDTSNTRSDEPAADAPIPPRSPRAPGSILALGVAMAALLTVFGVWASRNIPPLKLTGATGSARTEALAPPEKSAAPLRADSPPPEDEEAAAVGSPRTPPRHTAPVAPESSASLRGGAPVSAAGSARPAPLAPSAHAEPDRSTESTELGTLDFTADLPASVVLAGRTIGTTPLRGVQRPAARYSVTFVSADLGERVGTSFELRPGTALGVHAEFTGAAPAVRLR